MEATAYAHGSFRFITSFDTIAPAARPIARLAKAPTTDPFDKVSSHPGVKRFGIIP
jgi:hypothetical protein